MGVTFRPKLFRKLFSLLHTLFPFSLMDFIHHKALEMAEPHNEAICHPESLHGER